MKASKLAEYFRYTSGRWLYNESKRLSERFLRFDVSALSRAAAASVGRSNGDVKSIRKLAEGGFNRTFELTMNDGLEMIARLPYPCTQPKRLAVASEVATMDFVRSQGIPVPQIYGYSTDENNLVGAEYILMEKVKGRLLGDIWFTTSERDRIKVLSGIVDIEAKLFALRFPASGSLYYDEDLPGNMDRVPCQFENIAKSTCIGPDASLKFWHEERSAMNVPRGPCMTSEEVLMTPAAKEMAWLAAYGKPRLPFDRVYRDITDYEKSDPQDHHASLEMYSKIVPSLVPEADFLSLPTLRHPDLNPNNIFVSDQLDIVGMIDWQHSKILPLFLQSGLPGSIQNYGDPESEGLVQPKLPADLDEWDEDDREKELETYRRRHVHFYYFGATAKKNDRHFQALMHPAAPFNGKIFQHAGEPWEGNNIPLKADLIQLAQRWPELAPRGQEGGKRESECPLSFKEQEAEQYTQAVIRQENAEIRMEILRDVLGTGSDGWTTDQGYESAMKQAAEMKEQALGYAEDDFEREMTERHWPFDDFDEKE